MGECQDIRFGLTRCDDGIKLDTYVHDMFTECTGWLGLKHVTNTILLFRIISFKSILIVSIVSAAQS